MSDPVEIVWAYYRGELPRWTVADTDSPGNQLMERGDSYLRTIRVYREKGQTLIEHVVNRLSRTS